MEITVQTQPYNEKRYGKPWIALVDFSTAKGEFQFGDWIGDWRNGGEGTLTIKAKQGDIVAIGQKDNRNPKYSAPDFYVVSAEGKLDSIGDKGKAYKYFQENKAKGVDKDALIAERDSILIRLKEIEELLRDD